MIQFETEAWMELILLLMITDCNEPTEHTVIISLFLLFVRLQIQQSRN